MNSREQRGACGRAGAGGCGAIAWLLGVRCCWAVCAEALWVCESSTACENSREQ